ncbi:MAG: hypothetical protein QOF84_1490 [Streptomyces sp.]|nr:hypothetical protein [Streptomyces sp.]
MLDDVTDPADLHGLWPAASPYGRTLVTTRRRDAALTGDGRRMIEVGLFTPGEATAYLTAALAARDRTEPDDQLAALALKLGYLPPDRHAADRGGVVHRGGRSCRVPTPPPIATTRSASSR